MKSQIENTNHKKLCTVLLKVTADAYILQVIAVQHENIRSLGAPVNVKVGEIWI